MIHRGDGTTMASIELRVERHEDSWTVRHDHALFERFAKARDALSQAMQQAETLRRAGHQARVRLTGRRDPAYRRFPKDRLPGDLPPYEC